MTTYIPVTPGGTVLIHLESSSADVAWSKLLKDTRHMPYRNKAEMQKLGYEVWKSEGNNND